ncbi:MAG: cytochrome c oxidase assembly protein [Gammaproteobacteria bacterium]|nr:cytochrome c oxidase assembly protein [Gammaproteobacteria bacterium]
MRRWILVLGLLVLAAAWLGPLPGLAPRAFFAHMSMHVCVVAIAAPLIAVGLAGSAWDPVRWRPALFAPLPASVLEFVIVWAWHAPALHHAARHVPLALIAEQASFLLAGLMLWLSAFGGRPELRTSRAGAGIAGLLATSMHMTLLGTLLALASRPLYAHAAGGFAGLTPLEDQHLGGLLMLIVGGAAYLIGGLCLLAGLLRSPIVASAGAHTRRAEMS